MDRLGSHVFPWTGTVALGGGKLCWPAWVRATPTAGVSHPRKDAAQEKNRHLQVFAKNFLPLDLGPYEQSKVRKSWTWDQETRGQV